MGLLITLQVGMHCLDAIAETVVDRNIMSTFHNSDLVVKWIQSLHMHIFHLPFPSVLIFSFLW